MWAATVQEWFDDPNHPERQVGWVVPEDTPDYARPMRRLAIRWRKRNRQIGHDLLLSTFPPAAVMKLLGRPAREAHEPELAALAYAQLYDQRAGILFAMWRDGSEFDPLALRRSDAVAAAAV